MARTEKSRRQANGADQPEGALADRLRRLATATPPDRALPTTRELGERFGTANTTVFRVLRSLAAAGEIWQHPTNGRYYPPGARALLDRPKPVACLIRRLELGSELYRELLEGISAGCGERQRTMLLWHDERLVNHPDPHEPPVFATTIQQRAILHEFLDRHGSAAGGFLLDHLWNDEALRQHAARLQPAVVLFRSCELPGYSNVAVDFLAGALKALAHLLGRGFEHIIFIEPFAGDPAVAEFSVALSKAAAELECTSRLSSAPAGTPKERAALVDKVQRSSRRNALLCPEDNVAVLLTTALREAGIRCPERAGVLSVMGTDFAARAGLSCLRYDFRAVGRKAVEVLGSGQTVRHVFGPNFVSGNST
jgi:DNA-binding LacI/PurR family transcriptional regulator